MKHRLLVLGLAAVIPLSACGGGGSHATSSPSTSSPAPPPERTRLLTQVRSNLQASLSMMPEVTDLEDCVVGEAGKLPLSQLRVVASPRAGSSVTDPLLAHCVALGKGLEFVRGAIADVVAGKLPAPVPASFTRCVVAGVHALSAAALARAIDSSSSTGQAYARGVGERLALGCIRRPAVFAAWRRLWIGRVRRSLQAGRRLTPAFRTCALHKASNITAAQLIKIVQGGPAAETGYGRHLGELCRTAA